MYKLVNNLMTSQPAPFILRTVDNAYIPMDEQNSDYIAYLEWCKTNTPLPADEGVA
jgi:hypothetical protein